jgi:cell division cycle 14
MAGRKGDEHSSSSMRPTSIVYQPLSVPFLSLPMTLLTYADRLYLASYSHPPTSETIFPYPQPQTRASPSKRSQRAVDGTSSAPAKTSRQAPYYFTVDDTLLYNAFHHDFGPLHIGHLYRFALQFHDVLGAKENESRPIVFWSRADAKCTYSRALEATHKAN